jgi:hypothetical protein
LDVKRARARYVAGRVKRTGLPWFRLLSSRAVSESEQGALPPNRARGPISRRGFLRSPTARALLASLLVHAGVAVWFWSAPPPSLRAPNDDVSIEIVEVVPPPSPPAASEPPEPKTVPAPAGEVPPPIKPRVKSPTTPPPPTPQKTAPAAEAPSEPDGDLSLRDLPGRTHEVSPAREPGDVLLPPSRDLLARAGVSLEAPPGMALPDDRIGKRRSGPSRWQRNMDRLARIEAARAGVRGAPPETHDLWRDIERRFEPSHELVASLTKAEAGRAGSVSRWLGRYLGGFLADDPTEQGQPFERETAINRAIKAGTLTYDSRMCVHDGPNGEPIVEAEGGSGVPKLDELARKTVIEAAQRRVPGTGGGVRACFRFTARLSRVPPLPVLACGLGKGWKPECIYPLKEIVQTDVKLDGVEPGPQASATPPDAGG